jgi:hypothetical protein
MHFLIYVPGGRGSEDLAQVGLSDLTSGAWAKPYVAGPDGGTGVMFGWIVNGEPPAIRYSDEEQTWLPAVPFGNLEPERYWVGFWNRSLPTPGDLLRPKFHAGHNVALGDGNEWQVPSCGDLPHAYGLDDDGNWRLKVSREFRPIVEAAKAWEFRFRNSESLPAVEVLEFALQALGLNHRMTREVASHLKLFTAGPDGSLSVCLRHCIGAGGES